MSMPVSTAGLKADKWIYVSPYPLQDGEEQLLAEHEITFVQLGPSFAQWKSTKTVAKSSKVF